MNRVLAVIAAAAVLIGLLVTTAPAQATGPNGAPTPPASGERSFRMEVGHPPREVVGGTPATAGQYPYQVALAFADAPGIPIRGQFCGGSLIAPDTVLTASHCVIEELSGRIDSDGHVTHLRVGLMRPSELQILAGSVDLGANGGAQRLDVRRIRLDPDFTVDIAASFNFFIPDLAIVQLADDVAAPAEPVDLAVPGQENLYAGGAPATVTGWGATADVLAGAPTILQQATLPMVSDADCTTAYGTDFDATHNVCAGDLPTGLPSACYGDSGGPLVVDNGGEPLQVGVVLGGDGCGAPERPGVFTRVASNMAWVGRYLDPDEVPDRPRHVVVQQRNDTVRVSWRPPEFDGGTKITSYSVTVTGGDVALSSAGGGGGLRHFDLHMPPLQPGLTYTVKVEAVNAVGTGAARVRSFRLHPIALP